MAIPTVLVSGWRRFLGAFTVTDPQTLLEGVCEAYRAQAHAARQCVQHAERMYYPQCRTELLRIAAAEQVHLPWLRAQIRALGGTLPALSGPPARGGIVNLRLTKCEIIQYRAFKKITTTLCCSHVRL
jgi:hypothetical protein